MRRAHRKPSKKTSSFMEWAAFDMIREKGVRENNGRWGKQVEDVDGLL